MTTSGKGLRIGMLAVMVSLAVSSPAAFAITLGEAVNDVLRNHPDVESAARKLDASRQKVKTIRSDYLPTLDITATRRDAKGTQSTLQRDTLAKTTDAVLSWNLFNGFTTSKTAKAAKADAKSSEAQLEAAREELALRTTQAYMEVLRLNALNNAANDYVENLTKLRTLVRMRAENGRVAEVEAFQADSRLVQALNQRSNIEAARRTALTTFNELVGKLPQHMVAPGLLISDKSFTLAQLQQAAESANPQIIASTMNAMARKEDIGVAGGALYPSLDVEYRHRLNSDIDNVTEYDLDKENSVTLNYRLPLGGGSYSRKREAEFREKAALAERDSLVLKLRTSSADVYDQLKSANQMAPALQKNLDATRAIVTAYSAQFNAGKRSLLDVLSAWSERYQAQSDAINNWVTRVVSTAQIYSLKGELRQKVSELGTARYIEAKPAK